MNYGVYYKAHVRPSDCWFLVAILRSFEHLAFDRTYDKDTSEFEFFVPTDHEQRFLELMAYFEQENIVSQLTKEENRLIAQDL